MNQFKKTVSLLLMIALCMSLASAVFADEVEDVAGEDSLFDVLDGDNELPIIIDDDDISGTCGDALTWAVDTDMESLTITGTGAMTDWSTVYGAPWYGQRTYIADVTVSDGAATIGSYAFAGCTGLETITIPVTVTSVGDNAFLRTAALKTVYYAGTEEQWNAIAISDTGNDYLKNANIICLGGSVAFDWASDYTAATASLGDVWSVDCTISVTLDTTEVSGAVTAVPYTNADGRAVNRVVYTATAVSPDTGFVYTDEAEVYGLFGGWYYDTAFTMPYTAQPDGSAAAWPRLVDPVVLTVRYQLSFPTYSTDETTRLRIVTSVDSLDYESVGFILSYVRPSTGTVTTRTQMTEKAYSKLTGIDSLETFDYTPTVAFSEQSVYFCALMLPSFPGQLYYTPITVQPQWVTADGTTVYGTARAIQASESHSFIVEDTGA